MTNSLRGPSIHATNYRMQESNRVVRRVFTLLLTAALTFSGYAAAVCARDCAEGASLPKRASTGRAFAGAMGSCHDDVSTPATHDDQAPPLQSPLAPRPQNCLDHTQLSVVARPVARIVTFVPQTTNANTFLATDVNGLLPQRPASDSLVSSASPPASDLSPHSFTLRI